MPILSSLKSPSLLTPEMAAGLNFANLAVTEENAGEVFRWLALFAALPDPNVDIFDFENTHGGDRVGYASTLAKSDAAADRLTEFFSDPLMLAQASLMQALATLQDLISVAADAGDSVTQSDLIDQFNFMAQGSTDEWIDFTGLWPSFEVFAGLYDLSILELAIRSGILGGTIDPNTGEPSVDKGTSLLKTVGGIVGGTLLAMFVGRLF